MATVFIEKDRCFGDGLCLKACSLDCFQIAPDGKAQWLEGAEKRCIECGHCVAVCPVGAVQLNGLPAADLPPARVDIPAEQVERLFRSRRSIRHFVPRPVDRNQLAKAVATAGYAPTGANRRGVGCTVVDSPEVLGQVRNLLAEWMRPFSRWKGHVANHDAGIDTILRKAPGLAVAWAATMPSRYGDAEAPSYMSPQACASMVSYLEVLLHHAGIGTCWSGLVVRGAAVLPELQTLLRIPEGNTAYAALLLGYPAIRYTRIPWRSQEEIVWI